MILNLLIKEDSLKFHYGPISKMIQRTREQFAANGGELEDFPWHLTKAGVIMDSGIIYISGEFETLAYLTFAK